MVVGKAHKEQREGRRQGKMNGNVTREREEVKSLASCKGVCVFVCVSAYVYGVCVERNVWERVQGIRPIAKSGGSQ